MREENDVCQGIAEKIAKFERQGYFCLDREFAPGKPVFIRTIGLRDTFAKDVAKEKAAG